jgi:hypothetical protein
MKTIYSALMMAYFANNNWNENDREEFEKKIKERYKKILLKKGIKEYTFGNITVLALNEKNAKRKISNIEKQISKCKM